MTDVVIPKIGESVATVSINRWVVKAGDRVAAGQTLLEIDSDKASMEVPAPEAGVVVDLLAQEGDEVAVGAVVAKLDAIGSSAAAAPAPAPAAASPVEPKAGPAARVAANEAGIDLHGVQGTGPHGRVMTADVARRPAPAPEPVPAAAVGAVTRVKMSPIRRTIARRLVEAQQSAAMLTTFNEVDMSRVLDLRKRYQDAFVKRHGLKLGFMSFFVKAAIDALKQFPAVNAEIDGTDILYKQFYHIGVAVSGPRGLVVPVVRDADRMSFAEVERAIGEVSARARDNALRPEDFEGGTFTISNGGVFGSMLSTPILNPPQVGILGMHNIVERPVAVDGQVVVRPVMYLALTYDHRLIDGREAVSFLVRIKEAVENPERILLET